MPFPTTYTPEPTKPSKGPMSGTKALYNFCLLHFDVKGLGIYNPRDIAGHLWPNWTTTGSQHASGRAGDLGVDIVRPGGDPEGHYLAQWQVTNSAALGVQEVIFAGQRWSNQTKAWRHYTGRSDHFDHVHFAQNAEGAGGLTLDMIQAVWDRSNTEDDMTPEQYTRIVGSLDKIQGGLDEVFKKVAAAETDLAELKAQAAKP